MCTHNDGEHGCCGKHGSEHGGASMTKEEKVAAVKAGKDVEDEED